MPPPLMLSVFWDVSECPLTVVDINMIIEDYIERIQFSVTNLGKRDVFLGHVSRTMWSRSRVTRSYSGVEGS